MPLSKTQLALIHTAKRQLGLGDEDYRALLKRVAGVESAKDLDGEGFEAVMDEFRRLGFVSTFYAENMGGREGMASAGQVAKIRSLWDRYTAGEGNDLTLGKWLDRQFKISGLRFVTESSAQKVIGALTNMTRRPKAPAS